MYLYFIRHAQSANNDLYARTRSSIGREADPTLTELGHRQAQVLAQYLASGESDRQRKTQLVGEYAARHDRPGIVLTHLYCSLMTRAVQTGSYVAEATGLTLTAWPEIHERGGLHLVDEATGEDRGIPGPDRGYFERDYPHVVLPEAFGVTGWWNRAIETIDESQVRAKLVWEQLLTRHGDTDDRVAVISHGGFFQSLIRAILAPLRDWPVMDQEQGYPWFGVSNVSISRFEVEDGEVVVRYLNRVDFLPDELISG